mgnify:CR=1 FL=1
MKSYIELINVLNKHSNDNGSDLSLLNKSEDTFNFFDLFDVLVWKLNLKNNSFNLISSDFDYKNISTCDFKKFLKNIKPCFQEYFLNYFKNYFQLLFENKLLLAEFRFQGFIPLKLTEEDYTLSNICIIPIKTNHKVDGFYFTVTPFKKYRNEFPHFSVLKDRKEQKLMTYQLNKKVRISDLLTNKQSEVFELILNGYSSTKIAIHLGVKKETVFSYNIRIKDKMTAFFEIDFETVIDAANYYKNCFIVK